MRRVEKGGAERAWAWLILGSLRLALGWVGLGWVS